MNGIKKKIFLLQLFVFLVFACGAASACEVNGRDWSKSVNGVVQALNEGDYQKLKEVIGKDIYSQESESFDKLISNLNEYSPSGFSSCRELMSLEIPPLAAKSILEFTGRNGKGIYVYLFLIGGEKRYRSGIQIFRISTGLEDILQNW
ncbi:MAG: hypothetical protein NXH99_24015 [Rhodobacteraceae bacterium]|nr:hypothetical protein [Paracoccaceae bacterium]